MVGKMRSLFPSTRALIIKDSKRPHGQAVKTSPSHGGIWGSIPHGGTKKSYTIVWDFYLFLLVSFTWGIAHFVCVALPHEPQNTGLAFNYTNKFARFTITLTPFSTIPHGGTKKILHDCVGFLLIPSRFFHMVFKLVYRLFINIPQKNRRSRWTAPLCLW